MRGLKYQQSLPIMIELRRIYFAPDLSRDDLLDDVSWKDTIQDIAMEYPYLDDEHIYFIFTNNGVAFYAPREAVKCHKTY